MSRPMTVSGSVEIAADPQTVYAEIADPDRMRRWSPENVGTGDPARGVLSAGDEFVGHNRRGPARWSTRCTVIAAEPGKRFAFRVHRYGFGRVLVPVSVATWSYTFEEVAPGRTRVTETWQDDRTRWPDPLAARFDRLVTRGRTFDVYQAGNIRRTLDRLREDLESR